LLEIPPLLFFSFGFWAMTNQQTFENKPGHYELVADQTSFSPGHTAAKSLKSFGWNPGGICLTMFCCYFMYLFTSYIIESCKSAKFLFEKKSQRSKSLAFSRMSELLSDRRSSSVAVTDENIGYYFDRVGKLNREEWLKSELWKEKRLNFRVPKDLFKQLANSHDGEKGN
jgi:hypothetical protein